MPVRVAGAGSGRKFRKKVPEVPESFGVWCVGSGERFGKVSGLASARRIASSAPLINDCGGATAMVNRPTAASQKNELDNFQISNFE